MQRICLITPPSAFLLDERVFMNLGILRVAAVMEQKGWHVNHLDLSGISNYLEVIDAHLEQSDEVLFGLTATTAQLPDAVKIADRLHDLRSNARVILGGPHPTLAHAAYKREQSKQLTHEGRGTRGMEHLKQHFDVIVAGDGELAIHEACRKNAPQIIDADERKGDLFMSNQQLEALPFPARHLVDVESYHYKIEGRPALSLIAQLGCPFACGFCAGRYSSMLRHIRTRSSESIVAEMVHMYETYGHTGFMFYDDELNVNTKMVELMSQIAEAQERLGVEWRLRGFLKAELFTAEQAAAMYRAGFRQLLVGFESGSPQILDTIQKRATREDNTRCIEIAHAHGIKVKALMSLGHPGESRVTAQETLDWLLAVKPSDFDVTVITPYAGSPYFDDASPTEVDGVWVYTCKNGERLYQYELDYTQEADYYKGDPDDGYVAHVYTDYLSSEEIVAERDRVERTVRAELGIPFNPGAAATQYEHSMGQSKLPSSILRTSTKHKVRAVS